VSLRDTARIEVDAMPDTAFTGTVTEIANTAVTRGRGTQEEITSFPVKIAFAIAIPALRPGMSANVEVVTDSRQDVVQVPIQAVTLREPAKPAPGGEKAAAPGETREIALAEASEAHAAPVAAEPEEEKRSEAVFVMKDGKAELRPVKTGLSGESNIEILSGIEAGEEVVVGSYRLVSRELQDGNAIKKVDKSKQRGGHGGQGNGNGNGGENHGEGGGGRG
jgi:HlyD family secretion protein